MRTAASDDDHSTSPHLALRRWRLRSGQKGMGMKVRVKQRCAPVLTFIAAALGIPATDAQTPSFKSAVSLLTVDVTVLDQQDRPALGLTEGDFEVKVNGVLRPVRAVTFVEVSRKTSSDPS